MPPRSAQQNPAPNTPQKKPIIYELGVPNFDNSNKDKNFMKKLMEVDLGLHIFMSFVMVVLAGVIGLAIFRTNSTTTQVANNGGVTNQNQPKIAAEAEKSPVFINSQIVSIDEAFNSQPTQIKLTLTGALKKEVFGYLPYWVLNDLDQLDTRLLTSVSFFGLNVAADGQIVKDGSSSDNSGAVAWNAWQSDPKLNAFIRQMKKNRIKFYVTFKQFNNDTIERLVRSPQASQNFINNAIYQVSAKSLDGINVDFEYTGTPPDDVKQKFSLLMSNLNRELKRQYPNSKLTIATYARSAADPKGIFDVDLLAQNSDGLVIMGYDFHTPSSDQAGSVAPMGGQGENLLNFVNAYLEKVPPEKMILAVPYYGYDWPVSGNGVNAAVSGSNVRVLPYAAIVDAAKKTSFQWDDVTQTPWYNYVDPDTKQERIVHFDNARSLGIKYDFINKKNLAGVGIWALGFDGRNTDLEQLIADKFAN
jgi:chitinase